MAKALEMHLPTNELNREDLPAFLGPNTKHWKTCLSDCCFLTSTVLFLVTRSAVAGSLVYPR
ncbi:hypothetical protein Hanom_Chr00s000002g01600701 [Helianthus anomalus]